MLQNLLIGVTLFAHDGSTYLAESHSVSPAGPGKHEAGGDTGSRHLFPVYYKGRTVKVRGGKYAAYLQFLAYGKRLFASDDFQFPDASGRTSGQRLQVDDVAEIHPRPPADECRQFLLLVAYLPAVEVGGFLVIVIQYLR